MKIDKKDYLIIIVLILITIVRLLPVKNRFLSKFNISEAKKIYDQSQHAKNPNDRIKIMQDEDLYAFAGKEYLTKGNLNEINIEHPPLGKYWIGLSVILFNNPVILHILLAISAIVLLYLLSKKYLKSKLLSFFVVLGFILEFLFVKNVSYSLLDLPLLVGILGFLITEKPVLLGLFLGCIASIKYPAVAIILLGVQIIYWLLNNNFNKTIKKIFIVGLLAGIVFILTYSPVLFHQNTSSWFKLQEKALKIHLSHVPEYPAFSALKVMFLNKWPVWFDNQNPIHKTVEWNWRWPLLALSLLLSPLYLKFKKIKLKEVPRWYLFSWAYFIFINSRLFFPGYIFLLLPFLYLVLIDEIKFLSKKIKKVI